MNQRRKLPPVCASALSVALFAPLVGAAWAGPPKVIPLTEREETPVRATGAELLGRGAICVDFKDGAEPVLSSCASAADALFEGSDGQTARATRPVNEPVFGVLAARPERIGDAGAAVFVVLDALYTKRTSLTLREEGALAAADLPELAGWCRAEADGAVVVELIEGCARTATLPRFDPGAGGVAVKEVAGVLRDVGAGELVTERADPVSCEAGREQVLAVRAVPNRDVCAELVWPAMVELGRAEAQRAQLDPGAIDPTVRGLLADVGRLEDRMASLLRTAAAQDAELTEGQLSLAGARQVIEAAEGASDRRYLVLFTRLEELDASIAESVVQSGSLRQRVEALRPEITEVREKAGQGADTVVALDRLQAIAGDVLARLDALGAEQEALGARLRAIRLGVGYLQGGVAVGEANEAPAAPGRK